MKPITDDPRARIGEIWPTGIGIAQSWLDIGALIWLCDLYAIRNFVEFGTSQGGLSSLLFARVVFGGGFRYLGIDLETRFHSERLRIASEWFDQFDLLQADIFLPDTIQRIKGWIEQSGGRTLIYCDDGDKPEEFKLYWDLLKEGDVIALHDAGLEFQAADLEVPPALTRIESAWLSDTNIVAFAR